MDVDGLLLLMTQDKERFVKWEERSKNFSTKESGKSASEWLEHYRDAYAKYKDLQTGDAMKDATLMLAEQMYFHELCKFTLHAFIHYTTKLQEEGKGLRKPIKSRKKTSKMSQKRVQNKVLA